MKVLNKVRNHVEAWKCRLLLPIIDMIESSFILYFDRRLIFQMYFASFNVKDGTFRCVKSQSCEVIKYFWI